MMRRQAIVIAALSVVGTLCLGRLISFGLALSAGIVDPTRRAAPGVGARYPFRGEAKWFADPSRFELKPEPPLVVLGDEVTRAFDMDDQSLTFVGRLGGVNAGMDDFDTHQQAELFRQVIQPARPRQVLLIVRLENVMAHALSDRIVAMRSRRVRGNGQSPFGLLATLAHSLTEPDNRREVLAVTDAVNDTRGALAAHLEAPPGVLAEWTASLRVVQRGAADHLLVAILPDFMEVTDGRPHPVAEQIMDICSALGIPFIHLGKALGASDPRRAFADPTMLSPGGHAVVAAALADFLGAAPTHVASGSAAEPNTTRMH